MIGSVSQAQVQAPSASDQAPDMGSAIFPDAECYRRLIRALCVETQGTWLEDSSRYLNMLFLAAQKKGALRLAA